MEFADKQCYHHIETFVFRIESGTKKQKSEKVRSNNFFDEIDIAEDIELEEAIDAFFEEVNSIQTMT